MHCTYTYTHMFAVARCCCCSDNNVGGPTLHHLYFRFWVLKCYVRACVLTFLWQVYGSNSTPGINTANYTNAVDRYYSILVDAWRLMSVSFKG